MIYLKIKLITVALLGAFLLSSCGAQGERKRERVRGRTEPTTEESAEPETVTTTTPPPTTTTTTLSPYIDSRFPSSYDLRDYGLVSPIRDQGEYGTCQSCAWISAIENRLLASGINERLSVWAYYKTLLDDYPGFTNIDEKEAPISMHVSIVPERECPYPETYSEEIESSEIPENLRGRHDYLLSDVYVITDSSMDNVDIVNSVKEFVYEGYSVIGEICVSDNVFRNQESIYVAAELDKNNKWPDHVINVIGWDDNYKKGNFVISPKNDGAFLVQNSWGTQNGDKGYYWWSYDDMMMKHGNFAAVDVISGDSYDGIIEYNYDGWSYWEDEGNTVTAINGRKANEMWVASEFTADNNIVLGGIGVATGNSDEKCSVYIVDDIKDFDTSMQPVVTKDIKYRGTHVIDLGKDFEYKRGEKFTVVVKYEREEEDFLCVLSETKSGYGENVEGVSFVSSNGQSWFDPVNTKSLKNRYGGNVCGNVYLKAYYN